MPNYESAAIDDFEWREALCIASPPVHTQHSTRDAGVAGDETSADTMPIAAPRVYAVLMTLYRGDQLATFEEAILAAGARRVTPAASGSDIVTIAAKRPTWR